MDSCYGIFPLTTDFAQSIQLLIVPSPPHHQETSTAGGCIPWGPYDTLSFCSSTLFMLSRTTKLEMS